MSINENQANRCLELISDLYKWRISAFFRTPFDLEEEGLTDNNARIKKPMDLDTVKGKLLDGKYGTVDEFLADLRLICDNAVQVFGPDTVMTFMAKEFRAGIDEKAVFINMTPEQAWFANLQNLKEKIANHVQKRNSVTWLDCKPKSNEKRKKRKR